MPDERCRILRRRLARREQLVHARSRSKNEISAVLARRLIERPGFADLFGVTGRRWLAEVELPVEERESVDAGLRQIAFLDSEITAVEKLIAQQALALAGDPAVDDGPGREPDLRRDVHRRDRPSRPVPDQPQAGRLPRAGSEGPPVRRDAGAVGADLQARVGVARGGRWSRRRGAWSSSPARCARSTSASAPGVVTARRSSRPPANSRSCSGACSRRGEDYAHQRPALTKKKLRELELTAGAKPRTKAAAGIWSTNRAIRDAERALTLQAEISYQRMVTDQQAGRPARKVGASATPERA